MARKKKRSKIEEIIIFVLFMIFILWIALTYWDKLPDYLKDTIFYLVIGLVYVSMLYLLKKSKFLEGRF